MGCDGQELLAHLWCEIGIQGPEFFLVSMVKGETEAMSPWHRCDMARVHMSRMTRDKSPQRLTPLK